MICYNKEWENPLYWFDKVLTYTRHAEFRSYERDLPIVTFLPLNAKFLFSMKRKDVYALTFEATVNHRVMIIVVNTINKVVTVYPKILSKADEFQYKYKNYLGAFKKPNDFVTPVITLSDLVMAEFTEAELSEGFI
jgi:hypothetical protein